MSYMVREIHAIENCIDMYDVMKKNPQEREYTFISEFKKEIYHNVGNVHCIPVEQNVTEEDNPIIRYVSL